MSAIASRSFRPLLTGWNAAYAPSATAAGAKTGSQAAKNTARSALELELFKTLLTLSLNYPGDTTKIDLYMQASLLEPHTQGGSSATPAAAPAATPATGH